MTLSRIAAFLFSATAITSCGLHVDTTAAPPPIAAEKGDMYIDAGYSNSPMAEGSSSDDIRTRYLATGTLGVGYSLSDLDFIYSNVTSNFPEQFGVNHNINVTARYMRKINRTGRFEHFASVQYQLLNHATEGNTGNHGHAYGLGYIMRVNSSGNMQPYLGVHAGLGSSEGTNKIGMGIFNLGLQYRFVRSWEARVELNQSIAGDLGEFDWWHTGGGFNLQVRYLF